MIFLSTSSLYNCVLLLILFSSTLLYSTLLYSTLLYSTLLYMFSQLPHYIIVFSCSSCSTLLYLSSEFPHYIIVFSNSSCSLFYSTVHVVLHQVSPEAQGAILDAINEVFEPVVSQVIIICSIDKIVT